MTVQFLICVERRDESHGFAPLIDCAARAVCSRLVTTPRNNKDHATANKRPVAPLGIRGSGSARTTVRRFTQGWGGFPSLATASHWERTLSTVQYRYLRLIEALARVRKLMGIPMVQINIASEGGQQVVSNA